MLKRNGPIFLNMRLNKLSANSQKTEYMIIGHPRRTNKVEIYETLRLNNSDIRRVKKTKSFVTLIVFEIRQQT